MSPGSILSLPPHLPFSLLSPSPPLPQSHYSFTVRPCMRLLLTALSVIDPGSKVIIYFFRHVLLMHEAKEEKCETGNFFWNIYVALTYYQLSTWDEGGFYGVKRSYHITRKLGTGQFLLEDLNSCAMHVVETEERVI